ncbi:adhesin [Pseudomonas guariconensis]|uniref:adhesin n=1 Tax=Pseudomonas TaxID=286 RepID=UPI001CE3E8EF|nr:MULTISPECIES: adhesin [Pseudomonas]MCO7639037.1 adhesin [Pseudomonas sp. S 311-6]MCO7514325.1 adhesin [Pseudomonas putida]MCO7564866.1 adhesin [Pseudomonas mosselii]MCO7593763.1 adhesin [Pseudomonas guariconensis]MCO7606008.1 adhesin [Pseudomonas guariconensis]
MRALTLSLLCLAASAGHALAASPVVDNATLDASGRAYQGNLSINQAAGDALQQANARAIAIGTQANASTQIRQRSDFQANPALDARASISGNAFSHGSGMLGINQSAGAATQQANAVRIGISAAPQSIDDNLLSQQNVSLANGSDATDRAPGSRQVTTSDQAFTGSRGVIQLNQSAGVGNRMANTLSVRVAD